MPFTDSVAHVAAGPAAAPADAADTAPSLDFVPVVLARRSDGWTPERQRAFIEQLASCGTVCEAAARVGMTDQSARRLRHRPDAASLNRAWENALRVSSVRRRSVAYERAVLGTVRHRTYRGKLVGEDRIFDNRLLACLLGLADLRK